MNFPYIYYLFDNSKGLSIEALLGYKDIYTKNKDLKELYYNINIKPKGEPSESKVLHRLTLVNVNNGKKYDYDLKNTETNEIVLSNKNVSKTSLKLEVVEYFRDNKLIVVTPPLDTNQKIYSVQEFEKADDKEQKRFSSKVGGGETIGKDNLFSTIKSFSDLNNCPKLVNFFRSYKTSDYISTILSRELKDLFFLPIWGVRYILEEFTSYNSSLKLNHLYSLDKNLEKELCQKLLLPSETLIPKSGDSLYTIYSTQDILETLLFLEEKIQYLSLSYSNILLTKKEDEQIS